MKVLLSPAKSMSSNLPDFPFIGTSPIFSIKTQQLISVLKNWSSKDFKLKMKVSDSISESTYQSYSQWSLNNNKNGLPSIFLYSGTAFKGLASNLMSQKDINYAQNNLYILSGLYGLLKPLDIIHPYRLEMAFKFNINKTTDSLYSFWRDVITDYINNTFENELIVNLASNEYSKVIDRKTLNPDILEFQFLENKNGVEKVIANHSKMARGLLARYIIKNQIKEKTKLLSFNSNGYCFRDDLSTESEYVFSRNH